MAKQQVGGSFAPPITAELLAKYQTLAGATTPQVKDAMLRLCTMVEVFHRTPESKLEGTPHDSGKGVVVPLEEVEIKRIWDYVPWDYECDAIGVVFDVLTGDVRNAAYHLLWYARELAMDREPITTDKL